MEDKKGPKTALPLDFEHRPHLHPAKSCLLSAAGGVLLALCYEPVNAFFLAWFAFIPIIFAVRARKDKAVFWLGTLSGFIFFLVSLFWLRTIHFSVPFLLAAFWSPLWGLWLWITKKMWFYLTFPDVEMSISDARNRDFCLSWKKYLILILASSFIWTFFEWLRFWLFSGFPWNVLGISQAYFESLIPMASIFGVLGISFLIIFVNLTLSFLVECFSLSKKFLWQLIPLPLVLFTALIIVGSTPRDFKSNPEQMTVVLVQGKFDPIRGRQPTHEEYLEQIQTYRNLSLKHAADKPELIIWPETPIISNYSEDPFFQKAVKDVARICRSKILFGSINNQEFSAGNRKTNAAFLVDQKGELIGRYDKIHLVPYGEYTPMKSILPSSLWNWLNKKIGMGNLDKGTSYNVLPVNEQFNAGVNICFEDVFPKNSREYVRNGANILITLTNDSWYKESAGGAQHTAHSIFRAVENGLPLIRCGTTSESCFINERGQISELIIAENGSRFSRGSKLIKVSLHTYPGQTFYYRHPNLFPILTSIMAFLAFLSSALHFLKRKSRLREIISGRS